MDDLDAKDFLIQNREFSDRVLFFRQVIDPSLLFGYLNKALDTMMIEQGLLINQRLLDV